AQKDTCARGQPHERVTGGLLLVVALHLHDPAGRSAVADRTTDQLARHLVHRALVEVASHETCASSRSTSRARSSCSRTRGRAVPPSDTFDSSHAPPASSSW